MASQISRYALDLSPLGRVIRASNYVSSGSGTSADPFVPNMTALAATFADNTCVDLEGYKFATATTLDLAAYRQFYLVGSGVRVAEWRYTGSGTAIQSVSASTDYAQMPFGCVFDGFKLDGGLHGVGGIFLQHWQDGIIRNIRIRNFSGAKLNMKFTIGSSLDDVDLRGANPDNDPDAVTPNYGLILDASPINNLPSSFPVIKNIKVEVATIAGIDIRNCQGARMFGGYVEACSGVGVNIPAASVDNDIYGLDVESNGSGDFIIAGSRNHLVGCTSTSSPVGINITNGVGNRLTNVKAGVVLVGSAAVNPIVDNLTYGYGGQGSSYINNSTTLSSRLVSDVFGNVLANSQPIQGNQQLTFDPSTKTLTVGGVAGVGTTAMGSGGGTFAGDNNGAVYTNAAAGQPAYINGIAVVTPQHPTSARPAWSSGIKGYEYFDTTLNKKVVAGASAWEVVTSA